MEETLKTYIGTKEVKAAPMDEATAVKKALLAKTRIITNGDLAIMYSTQTLMAAPMTPGHQRMSSKMPTKWPTIL